MLTQHQRHPRFALGQVAGPVNAVQVAPGYVFFNARPNTRPRRVISLRSLTHRGIFARRVAEGKRMLILGWNGEATLQATDDSQGTHGHDAAAALICDGKVIAAIEEERLNRVKHTSCFPTRAIEFCLRQGGADLKEVDAIAAGLTEESWD